MTEIADEQLRRQLDDEAARLMEDAEHTYKSHWNSADTWAALRYVLGVPSVILATLAGAGATQLWRPLLIAGLAVASAALTGLMTFVNPAQKSRESRDAGNAFKAIHVALRQFRYLDNPRLSIQDSRAELARLTQTRENLIATSPGYTWGARLRARRGIEQGESRHEVDRGKAAT